MTGTPLDLTPFGPFLSWLGAAYWLLAVALAGFVLWVKARWWIKAPVAVAILAAFVYPVLTREKEVKQQVDASRIKLEAAMAHFEMRCKSAGEKISRKVENVDGVVWMKWREPYTNDFADQFKLNDPYGRDCGAETCIEALLRVTKGRALNPDGAKLHALGFGFVDTTDPRSGQKFRYSGAMKLAPSWTAQGVEEHRKKTGQDPPSFSHTFQLERVPVDALEARYGITWDDISTREDRELWIAGGSLKVIDLQTNEVIAERVGYMIDQGQGGTGGGRSPWLFAEQVACPPFREIGPSDSRRRRSFLETRQFVNKVLTSKSGG